MGAFCRRCERILCIYGILRVYMPGAGILFDDLSFHLQGLSEDFPVFPAGDGHYVFPFPDLKVYPGVGGYDQYFVCAYGGIFLYCGDGVRDYQEVFHEEQQPVSAGAEILRKMVEAGSM